MQCALRGALPLEGHGHLPTLPLSPLGQAVEGQGMQRRGLLLSFCAGSSRQPNTRVWEDGAVLSPQGILFLGLL